MFAPLNNGGYFWHCETDKLEDNTSLSTDKHIDINNAKPCPVHVVGTDGTFTHVP